MRRRWSPTSVLAALAALWACDLADEGIGAPCDSDADCGSGLVCDIHGGRGSCQRPHGHDDGGSSTSATTSTTSTTTGAMTDGSTSSDASTGGAADTGTTGTTGDQTSGAPQDCLSYCACLVDTCSTFAGYPHADIGECMSACETLDAPTFTCLADACAEAQDAEPDLVEPQCQQAWGEPGVSAC